METNLINKSQVKKAIKVNGLLGNILSSLAMSVIGAKDINEIHSKLG
jgi:hypothetical protein